MGYLFQILIMSLMSFGNYNGNIDFGETLTVDATLKTSKI